MPPVQEFPVWLVIIIFTILTGLIAYIWKTSRSQMEELQKMAQGIQKDNVANSTSIELIRQNCTLKHQADVHEGDIRNILRDELDRFRSEFSAEIQRCVKITLIEDGYIKAPSNKQRKRSVAEE